MSSPHTHEPRFVLIVSDRQDAVLGPCADALGHSGAIVAWAANVYAAMSRLAITRQTTCIVVDIRRLDDYEMRFLSLVPCDRDAIRILVPIFEGTAERSATCGGRFLMMPPDRLVEAIIDESAWANESPRSDSRVVEWGPARTSITLSIPADEVLPPMSARLSAQDSVPTPPAEVTPSDSSPTTEESPSTVEASMPTRDAIAPQPIVPQPIIPQPIDLMAIPDAIEKPDAIEVPESRETPNEVYSRSVERIPSAEPSPALSTDGATEGAPKGPALYEAVRQRMAGSHHAFNRRRPPQRQEGSRDSQKSRPPAPAPIALPPAPPTAETSALTNEEMDALLSEDKGIRSEGPVANDSRSEPAP